jgi:hypothetical protein
MIKKTDSYGNTQLVKQKELIEQIKSSEKILVRVRGNKFIEGELSFENSERSIWTLTILDAEKDEL